MEKKEKNNNVILLIVIAIATMVIVVIGATFAYLASSTADNGSTNINAGFEAGGSDLLLIDAGKELSVEARFDNFGKGEGDQNDYGMAKVVLQAAKGGSTNYTYDVFLDTEENDMIYTAGACYKVTTEVAGGLDQNACVDGNNLWARVSGSEDAACYAKTADALTGQLYESEQGCLTDSSNMWAIDDGIAELAFDIYKPVEGVDDAVTCTADHVEDPSTTLGTCIDKKREIYDADDASACIQAGYTWVDNYFDTDTKICYKVDKSFDITVATTGESGKIPVYSNVAIAADNGDTTTHNYRVGVTLVNLPHNQIANGGHTYKGRLNIQVQPKVAPETPETGE